MGDEVLELEHVVGYTGANADTLVYHPQKQDAILYSIGSVFVIADVKDPHSQEVMRGHDETITALNVSKSGRLVATGQLGSTARSGEEAPVFVWDFEEKRELYRLFGLNQRVMAVKFTEDDRLLAATDCNRRLWIWDLQTGHIACGTTFSKQVTSIVWAPIEDGPQTTKRKQQKYILAAALENGEMKHVTIDFDVRSMQFRQAVDSFAMPSQGMYRVYNCLLFSSDGNYLLAGTAAGEFCVFAVRTKVYRASVPISSNGVKCLCIGGNSVYAAAGDGKVRKLAGEDQTWTMEATAQLDGMVTSLSISQDGCELLAGTSHGLIHRVLVDDLSYSDVAKSHTQSVIGSCFGSRSDIFCTASQDGTICVWDLSDYSLISRYFDPKVKPTFVYFDQDHTIFSGWADGSIRSTAAANGALLKSRAGCHRGAVTSIDMTSRILVSGGEDGCVRVWSLPNLEFLSQFSSHQKPVTSVLIDMNQPNLVHSSSLDRTVVTNDLKTERKVNYHMWKGGSLTRMSQRKDSENELVTVGNDGCVLFWDCDYSEAVQQWVDPNGTRINDVQISPSGRFAVTCGDDLRVKVWEVAANRLLAVGLCHSSLVNSASWSPDEKQIVSVAKDGSVCVWNFYGLE